MDNDIRNLLPDNEKKSFDNIVEQRVLGAGNHISMIGHMIESIAVRGKSENRETASVISDIKRVAAFFIETRGEASQAVSNAIRIMIHEIDRFGSMDIKAAADEICNIKNSYEKSAREAVEKAVGYAVKLAEEMNCIFVFDYSSTVEKFLRRLKDNGKKYTIYIAESRIINGGLPFVKPCQEAGHNLIFIPDASMMYYMKNCDGAFMGAETFYPDGTAFNTTGSDIAALICRHYKIPLYFLTPLIKLDIRPVIGGRKNLVFDDMKDKLTRDWPAEIDRDAVSFITPELIGVESCFIKGFVTEQGVIPSGQMYGISMEYSRRLRGQ